MLYIRLSVKVAFFQTQTALWVVLVSMIGGEPV